MILLQITNQEGWSSDKAFVEAQQVWEHDSYVTTATETSPVHPEMPTRVGVLPHLPRQCQGNYSKKVDIPDMGTYKEGEKVLKEDEQSHFKKLVENIKSDLHLDAMEMACSFEKVRIKDIEKAERILKKAKERGNEPQSRNYGDSKEAVLMECADGSYNKPTETDSYEEKLLAMVGEGGRTYLILWENGKFPRPARYVVAAEARGGRFWTRGVPLCDV